MTIMIGIIYKFTIICGYKFNNQKPFYVGQHWTNETPERFKSVKSRYWGSGSIWNDFINKIKKDYHKYACFASLFSLCAGEQGKYWESMDEIYTMSALSEDKGDLQVKKEFEEIIDDLGLDKIAFNECLESRRYINKIITDIEEAKSLNIPGTPFVFINGKQLKNRNEIIMEEIFNYILSNN